MTLEELIEEKKWQELASAFNPKDVAQSLSFLVGIKLAYFLLYNKKWDENIQEFAVQLLEAIRIFYPKEWNSSWQYDAFLGLAYHITLKYNYKYEALKRALKKINNPPPQLLIAIASCCDCPGKPPISYEQAIEYLKLALKDYLYVDGVGLMRKIYWFKDDAINENHWAKVLQQIENDNMESPSLDPDFLKTSSH